MGDAGASNNPLVLRVFSDADYAGCAQAQRSTTGAVVFLARKGASVPLSFWSKRQSCVSRSTSEAEVVAMGTSLPLRALPLMLLVEEVVGSTRIQIAGDNSSTLFCLKTGRNPTMRHLSRTHRVSAAWLHEQHVRRISTSITCRPMVWLLTYSRGRLMSL